MTPPLIPGNDYGHSKKWPVVTKRMLRKELGRDLGAIYEFYSGEHLIARHNRGVLTLMKGYACDGYSPSIPTPLGRLSLTPIPVAGMGPAIWHDFERQYVLVYGCPWTREDTDRDFYNDLIAGGTSKKIAGGYYCVLESKVGTAYIALTRKIDPKLYIIRTPYPEHR